MASFSVRHQILGMITWLAISFLASAIGAVASVDASEFYAGLVQPGWAPPASAFGPVWTALYALMGVAAWLVWREGGFRAHRGVLILFLVQLAVNALWSWLFFVWRLGFWSLADIVVLWLLIAATLAGFWRVRPLAGVLLLPYLAWVSFAAVLCHAMWRLNPAVLG